MLNNTWSLTTINIVFFWTGTKEIRQSRLLGRCNTDKVLRYSRMYSFFSFRKEEFPRTVSHAHKNLFNNPMYSMIHWIQGPEEQRMDNSSQLATTRIYKNLFNQTQEFIQPKAVLNGSATTTKLYLSPRSFSPGRRRKDLVVQKNQMFVNLSRGRPRGQLVLPTNTWTL